MIDGAFFLQMNFFQLHFHQTHHSRIDFVQSAIVDSDHSTKENELITDKRKIEILF